MKLLILKIISLTLFRDPTVDILTPRMHTEAGVSIAEFSRLRSYWSGFLLYTSLLMVHFIQCTIYGTYYIQQQASFWNSFRITGGFL
jgi:hypothetical protein